MTAFFSLLDTYAIFFYLAGVIVVLLGIKMLFDARRAGRTTLFTLEQEQASDRAFRAAMVMLAATLFIGAVAGINAFVGPVVPTATPDVAQPTVLLFTPPVILPTSTPQPTETALPPPVTPVTVAPTKAASKVTAAATAPRTQATATAAATAPPPPTAVPPTPALIYLAPPLNIPPNGDSIGSNRIQFRWGTDEGGNQAVPETLPQDQFYRLVINYTDKTKNAPAAPLVLCTHESSADQRTGITVTEYRTEAVDNLFRWNVTVVRAASQGACEAGEFTPLSPPSTTFRFLLP